ncbi:HugZ family pyridoxamine 5'-phosphate oxidase [Albidovulum sp.]
MAQSPSPIRPTDDAARRLACSLIAEAHIAALAVLEPQTGWPFVSRIAVAPLPPGEVLTLISDLSQHARALAADPRASLLLGEAGPRGDPLTHPRLTLRVTARQLPQAERPRLRALWLARHPKAKLYVDFADFRFVAFTIRDALLNGGFGKAYALAQNDLKLT